MGTLSRRGSFWELHTSCTFIHRGAVIVGAATYLLGCVDEDRVLTARCQATSDAFAAATFSPLDVSEATIGGLNARQDALGTIFHLVSGRSQSDGARATRVYTLIAHPMDVAHEIYWNSSSVHVRVKTELDGEELPESSRASIEAALLSGSAVVAWDVERQAIGNLLHALNEDLKALRILREAAPEDRYLVISSRLLARYVGMFYTPGGGLWLPDGRGSSSTQFVTPWTFRMGNTNFHSTYSCTSADELNSMANAGNGRVPAVYFYTAVRYDSATKRVERDSRVTDLDLLTAELSQTQ